MSLLQKVRVPHSQHVQSNECLCHPSLRLTLHNYHVVQELTKTLMEAHISIEWVLDKAR